MRITTAAYTILSVFCFILSSAMAGERDDLQQPLDNNAIFVELGGGGMLLSLNYNRVLSKSENYFVTGEIGVGPIPLVGGFVVPHNICFNYGQGNHLLLLGGGGSYYRGRTNASGFKDLVESYQIVPIAGYRYQGDSGVNIKLYLSPLINIYGAPMYDNQKILFYGGFAIGYGF